MMDPLSGIAVEIPSNVKQGEAARLFPVLSENSKEGRAASVFLASLSVVDAFADALLRRLGRPIGARTKINCFTEVVLKSNPQFRPDGLVVIDSGRDTWSALVECKIGKATIETEQLESYIKQARENDIDCVITISNELVPDPRRPPTMVDGRLTRAVSHFHYSWLAIRSEAEIAYAQSLVSDPEKNFILAELIRFLSHPSAGIEGFDQMPTVWPEVINEVGAGRAPKKSDPRLSELADAWLQQEKELSLILSRLVSRHCPSLSERRVRRAAYDPHDDVLTELASSQTLVTDFAVPDAASEISVRADLKSKSTRIFMTLKAPEDRKRPETRLNWLLSQLKNANPDKVEIVAYWPGRAKPTYGSLAALRDDPKLIIDQNEGMTPVSFEVAQTCHTAASFAGRRRFIQDLQAALQDFYGNVGKLLVAWAPKPPPPEEKTAAARIEEVSVIDTSRVVDLEASLAAVMNSLNTSNASQTPAAPSSPLEATKADDTANRPAEGGGSDI